MSALNKQAPPVPPKPSFLKHSLTAAKCFPITLQTLRYASALFDFDGVDEFQELSFKAGDKLAVEETEVDSEFSAWSIAHLRGDRYRRGLVPLEFLDFDESVSAEGFKLEDGLQPFQESSHATFDTESALTIDDVYGLESELKDDKLEHPQVPTNTVSNKVVLARELNRFSTFVLSGAEEYILTVVPVASKLRTSRGSSSTCLDPELYYIEDGPIWTENIKSFSVGVPSAQIISERSEQHVIYSVETLFCDETCSSTIVVDRRYSQFVTLHRVLAHCFPLIVLPRLPAKSLSSQLGSTFIERRRKALQGYLSRLVRHPILRSSDLLTSFLADEEPTSLETVYIARQCPNSPYSFFGQVIHPDWNQHDGEEAKVEDMGRRCDATLCHINNLLEEIGTSQAGEFKYVDNIRSFCLSLADLSTDREAFPEDELSTADGLLQMSSLTMLATSEVQTWSKKTLASTHSLLLEMKHALTQWSDLKAVHTATTRRLLAIRESNCPDTNTEAVENRIDTLFNILLAEMNLIEQQRKEDFEYISRNLVESQIACHEQAIAALKLQVRLPMSMTTRRHLIRKIDNSVVKHDSSVDTGFSQIRGATVGLMRLIRSYL